LRQKITNPSGDVQAGLLFASYVQVTVKNSPHFKVLLVLFLGKLKSLQAYSCRDSFGGRDWN